MDNSATSPIKEEVLKEMLPYLKEEFGNPSTLYTLGRNAKKGLDQARENVADLINADSKEIEECDKGRYNSHFSNACK